MDSIDRSIQYLNNLSLPDQTKYYLSVNSSGHDDSITISKGNNILEVIELEKFLGKKHVGFNHRFYTNYDESLKDYLRVVAYIKLKYTDTFETVFYLFRTFLPIFPIRGDTDQGSLDVRDNIKTWIGFELKDYFKSNNWVEISHHFSHAASAFYQSKFQKSFIYSIDGGSSDGVLNYFVMDREANRIRYFKPKQNSACVTYSALGFLISDIKKVDLNKKPVGYPLLDMPGKLMGFVGYGKPRPKLVSLFKRAMICRAIHLSNEETRKVDIQLFSNGINLINYKNLKDDERLNRPFSTTVAASMQEAFEKLFYECYLNTPEKVKNLPVCITGGGALNIINNTNFKKKTNIPVFVPPDPSDCGLSLGAMLGYLKPVMPFDDPFTGSEVYDFYLVDFLKYMMKDKITQTIIHSTQLPIVDNTKYYLSISCAGHDDNITISKGLEILEVIELEKFTGIKHVGLTYLYLKGEEEARAIIDNVLEYIFKKYTNTFEIVFFIERTFIPIRQKEETTIKKGYTEYDWFGIELRNRIKAKNWFEVSHHLSHASGAFYQSGFDKALVITFDGGSYDGTFHVFVMDRGGIPNHISKFDLSNSKLCSFYSKFGIFLEEIKIPTNNPALIYPGKIMGLAGHSTADPKLTFILEEILTWNEVDGLTEKMTSSMEYLIKNYGLDINPIFNFTEFYKQGIGLTTPVSRINGVEGRVLAASLQQAFNNVFASMVSPFIRMYSDLPVCISGGGALNIINNTNFKNIIKTDIFIPPDPSDCGLSLGSLLFFFNNQPCKINTFSGMEILDRDCLPQYINNNLYHVYDINCNFKILLEQILDNKIIGIVRGRSERGPRALGNRSIICTVLNPDMKDIINKKVKHREWFRPFSPVVRLEDVNKYFKWEEESRYMSYSPEVREEWIERIKPVVHVDGTARVQTITYEQHNFLYKLLTELEKISGIGMVLNTSFNVDGKPILNTVKDAFYVLETTELDGVLIEDTLFLKPQHRDFSIKATENQ